MNDLLMKLQLDPEQCALWLVKREAIFPERLLCLDKFARVANSCDIKIVGLPIESNTRLLWTLGLLRADVVRSEVQIANSDFREVMRDDHCSYYADCRPMPFRDRGWAGAGGSAQDFPGAWEPMFHPFRLYDLVHLERVFDIGIAHIQLLLNDAGYATLIPTIVDGFNRWSATSKFGSSLEYWRSTSTLAIVSQPCVQAEVRGTHTTWGRIGRDEYLAMLDAHWQDVKPTYQALGVELLSDLQGDIACESQKLDRNRELHTFLRLCKPEVWNRISGKLGAALRIRIVGETIRRTAEKALDIQFAEEDEIGFGQVFPGFKERDYGVSRLLDGNRLAAADFMRHNFVDHRVEARLYVEGHTEDGALKTFFGDSLLDSVEVVNLRAHVRQKGVLAFEDSLKLDERSGVYSFVMIDSDRDDFKEVLLKAAADDIFCGEYWLSSPDFEFHNFSLDELREIAWLFVLDNSKKQKPTSTLDPVLRSTLSLETAGAASGTTFEIGVRRALRCAGFGKSTSWGTALACFAAKNPTRQDGTKRPFLQAIRTVASFRGVPFIRTRREMKINPCNGKLERRIP